MDRLNQLRSETAGSSNNSFLDTSSTPSDYATANESSSSKFFSISDVDSTLEISSVDTTVNAAESDDLSVTETEKLISNLSPVSQKCDNFKIGKQIEAANILSGGVDIFDDNDNSYDGDELVIDDNVAVEMDDKTNMENRTDSQSDDNQTALCTDNTLVDTEVAIPSKDTEVVLQIDGKNVDAINIGNGLYLYRRDADDKELSAVQILDADQQQPTIKFLKVRENAEGNLEVYEEIVEVHKDPPDQDAISSEKSSSHGPIKDINKAINDQFPSNSKISEKNDDKDKKGNLNKIVEIDSTKECTESRSEVNLNGKTMKISDSCRKSPLIGSFTPMTFHSTPNKEGIPLTKTMVDLHLHPSRHNDAAKKTIEVTTDSCKHKVNESATIDMRDKEVVDCVVPNHEPGSNIGGVAENDSEMMIEKATEVPKPFDKDVSSDNKKIVSNLSQIQSQATTIPEKQESIDGNDSKLKISISPVKNPPGIKEFVTPTSNISDDTIKTHENTEIEEFKKQNVIMGISLTNIELNQNSPEELNDTVPKKEPLISTEINNRKENVNVREQKNGKDILQNVPFVTNATRVKEQRENISSKESIKETKHDVTTNVGISETKLESGIKLESHNINTKTTCCGSDESTSTKDKSNITIKNSETVTLIETVKINDNKSVNTKTEDKIDPQKTVTSLEKPKSINNNVAVPFGKWTEANKQEYLNKIKESKVPPNSGNTNQIKLPKDLNRRDVLNKIDIARHNTLSVKDSHSCTKPSVKSEPNKQITILPIAKRPENKVSKLESSQILSVDNTGSNMQKVECNQRTEINNQHLIDRTIEGILMDKLIAGKFAQESNSTNETHSSIKDGKFSKDQQFDDIERKLSELHGHSNKAKILDRQDYKANYEEKVDSQIHSTSKSNKLSNNVSSSGNAPGQSMSKEKSNEDDHSDEEILECEPITGDIDLHKHSASIITDVGALKVKPNILEIDVNKTCDKKSVNERTTRENTEESGGIITEKDFDKFARRTSVTYENCITVNFNAKQQANVVQPVIEKDNVKMDSKKLETLSKSHFRPLSFGNKNTIHSQTKTSSKDDESPANYTKLQLAYHTALNKRSKESPITVIEDKPVKVVLMENCSEFLPYQLNVQNQQLSSNKNITDILDSDTYTVSSRDSMDSDILLETMDSVKSHEENKIKRHQRKQVLTPVDTPEMELIEPKDLGIVTKNKRKRRSDDSKHTRDEPLSKRSSKCLVPKKSYLLGRVHEKESLNLKLPEEKLIEDKVVCNKMSLKEEETNSNVDRPSVFHHDNLVSNPIDNLVKAAELLEKQSENSSFIADLQTSESSTPQPIKRGRGRPRKYPIQDTDKSQTASPQKKIKLLDMEVTKPDTTSDEDSDDEGIARQNWTMGKINENIVCPICNKLFRSENVVFKHVKHCSGPSPTKADSPERSHSNDYQLNTNEVDTDTNKTDNRKNESSLTKNKNNGEKIIDEDVILIEDSFRNDEVETSSIQSVVEERDTRNKNVFSTDTSVELKEKEQTKVSSRSVYCECCGRTFRNMTYLINHKMLHKKNVPKKVDSNSSDKSVFSCEVCKKEYRKLHHLVQHRNNHNPSSTVGSKLRRKSSVGQNILKTPNTSPKSTDEQGAGFRCEPCDKSFRKLHHLVEHRETHDGINRLKNLSASQSSPEKNLNPPPQCDVCNKTFRKLHHLIEHKEQHVEASKTNEKSSKSTLVARDIIHECSLCYMVFPNEHALNKHFIICQRKKKSSKLKKLDNKEEVVKEQEACAASETNNEEEFNVAKQLDKNEVTISENMSDNKVNDKKVHINTESERPTGVEVKSSETLVDSGKTDDTINIPKVSPEIATTVEIPETKELDKSQELPKRRTPLRDRTASTVTKRSKSLRSSVNAEFKVTKVDLTDSDDDDVRYMFNPDYPADATKEFLKVRANKRDSLTLTKQKNNDATKTRISLQNPPKAPKINPKPNITIRAKISTSKPIIRKSHKETVPSTSDDYEIRYSFPKATPKIRKSVDTKTANMMTKLKENKEKSPNTRDKRKTVSTNRKSPVKTVGAKTQAKESPVKLKAVKRRTIEVGHKCDCGQLFNSAALLARHTTVAHTPPRRRRLSPPPDTAAPKTVPKSRRYVAHRGVPMPGKMKKLVDKLK